MYVNDDYSRLLENILHYLTKQPSFNLFVGFPLAELISS